MPNVFNVGMFSNAQFGREWPAIHLSLPVPRSGKVYGHRFSAHCSCWSPITYYKRVCQLGVYKDFACRRSVMDASEADLSIEDDPLHASLGSRQENRQPHLAIVSRPVALRVVHGGDLHFTRS